MEPLVADVAMTKFGRWIERTPESLVRETIGSAVDGTEVCLVQVLRT